MEKVYTHGDALKPKTELIFTILSRFSLCRSKKEINT